MSDDILDANAAVLSEAIKLSIFAQSYNLAGLPVQRIRSRFKARGTSPHQLAANLSSYLLLESGPGELNNSDVDRMFDSFVTQLLESVNPFFNKDIYIERECVVVGSKFNIGTALLDPEAIFRTDKMHMITTGDIRLHTEVMHLSIATKPRKRPSHQRHLLSDALPGCQWHTRKTANRYRYQERHRNRRHRGGNRWTVHTGQQFVEPAHEQDRPLQTRVQKRASAAG